MLNARHSICQRIQLYSIGCSSLACHCGLQAANEHYVSAQKELHLTPASLADPGRIHKLNTFVEKSHL